MMLRNFVGALVLFSLVALGAFAQEPAEPPAFTPTRRDLAQAYMMFESAWFRAQPPVEKHAELNRRFDALTKLFFSQKSADAIRGLRELALELDRQPSPTPADRALASLRVRADPEIWYQHPDSAPPTIHVRSLYELEQEHACDLSIAVELRSLGASSALQRFPLEAAFGPGKTIDRKITLSRELIDFKQGTYDIVLTVPDRPAVIAAQIFIYNFSVDEFRREMNEQATIIAGNGDTLLPAINIFKSRIALLEEPDSEETSAHFLTDWTAHIFLIQNEYRLLDDARNPYLNRPGHLWRTLELSEGRVLPLRLYAPQDARARLRPMPLVIALHGAGGDESMFMETYGAGLLTRLAEQYGFIAVAPSTVIFGSDPAIFDALLTDLERDYKIDRSRIYVVGHSLGAVAAAGLASARRDAIAAVACLAGYREIPLEPAPAPTLVIAGELDPIFPKDRTAPAQDAQKIGAPIEYRSKPDQGHTLIVNHTLGEAVEWLFARKLATDDNAQPGNQ